MKADTMDDIGVAALSFAPWQLSGTVYGALLNHAPELAALGAAVDAAPYKAAPKFPVLQVRPRNTLAVSRTPVELPADASELEIGVSLGIVIGRTAFRVAKEDASSVIAGYIAVAELSLPNASHYRPAVRFKARDGFTVLGDAIPASQISNPDALPVQVHLDGKEVWHGDTAERVRTVAALLEAVTEFMTLQPGDLLLLGSSTPAPRARAGDKVTVTIQGVGSAQFSVAAAATALPAKQRGPRPSASVGVALGPTARVVYGGSVYTATPHAQGVRLSDGRVLPQDAVQWLAPFDVGTILALGLNYADHVKELSKELTVTSKDEPLVFLKGPGAVVGHRGHTRRPSGVQFMHYECELAVVIGATAKNVHRDDAMQYVAGYTVCNDYAVRDYLENWYRPNLRVKNRDGATALGPWFVPAALVRDPHALALTTRVNGVVTQQGNTGNMVNDVAALIEYLSSFMTLQAGDVILTGTPEGVVNVNVGDEVVCEIEGIGMLINTIVGDVT